MALSVDRINGISGDLAIKAPCRVATTANITLAGFQTIDGVTPVEADTNLRVLVKNQTDTTQNGIYNMASGTWLRSTDFNGAYDVVKGTELTVQEGTVNGGFFFVVATADPVVIGTSALAFTSSTTAANSAIAAAASAVAAAASEVQTGLDAVATAADVVQTGLDAVATAADVVTTAAAVVAAQAAADAVMWNDVVFKTFADSPITVTNADAGRLLAIDCSGGAVTVNLPAIAGLTFTAPWSIGFKKTEASANAVTINRAGTDTIDGAASISLSSIQGLVLIPDTNPAPDTWTSMAFGDTSNTLLASVQVQSSTRFTAGGAADAITGTLTPTIAGYVAGLRVTTTAVSANTITNPTLNLNGLGAKTIKKRDASGTKAALSIGDYNASGPVDFEYDGTDFILLTIASGEITGVVKDYIGLTAPTGYVLLSGRTLGNAASGALERANADTEALFTLLWNSMANTEAAVSGGRGASAAADYAANKTITLPDGRGRTTVGKDNMGGTAANRITAGGAGINGTTLGAAGGAEVHTLTSAQSGLPVHSHTVTLPFQSISGATTHALTIGADTTYQGSATVGSAGGASASAAHQNVQPSLMLNKIIKL